MGTYELRVCSRVSDPSSYVELLNQSFNVPVGQSFLRDFPIWSHVFADQPSIRRFCIESGGRIVATASIRCMEVCPNSSTVIAVLGAVACHPDHRGQGLATRLIQQAMNWARSQKVSLVFLWSSEYAFYEKLGFQPFGIQVRCPLRLLLSAPESLTLSPPQRGLNAGILQRLRARDVPWVKDLGEDRFYPAHPHVQWYSLGTPNQVSAYAAIGRGIDLSEHVHEWGGDPEDLIRLLGWIERENSQRILLSSISALDHLFPSWRRLGVSHIPGDLPHSAVLEPLCLAHPIEGRFPAWWSLRGGVPELALSEMISESQWENSSRIWDQNSFWFWGLDAS